jgi:roadblock/LC7 domain-containing protein
MTIVANLLAQPGIVAAGQYAYRGDRFSYKGALTEHYARILSIMCRATTMATHMEGDMIASLCAQCGIKPVRGWVIRGSDNTLCVVTNVFCLIDNKHGSLNQALTMMNKALADEPMDLI